MSSLYVVAFAVSALLSGSLAKIFLSVAKKRNLFTPPIRERDIHSTPIPRIGGLAIVTSFLVVTLVISLVLPNALTFSAVKFWGIDQNLLGLLLAVVILGATNAYDDYRALPWQVRLTIQVFSALLIYWFGIHIPWLTNPFGGENWVLGHIGWLFVVIWLVGLSNVVNMLDGVDGLASGVSAIALAVLFFLSIRPDVSQEPNALISVIALGAVIGFLPLNISPAKAFLGDTGSVFLGFLIGVLAIISGGKVATAFLVLAIPLLDALVVVGSRILTGRSPFLADKRHLHHRLLELGMKSWQILTVFWGISLLFGLIALNTQALGKLRAAIAAFLLMAGFLGIYWIVIRVRRSRLGILKTDAK